MLIMFNASERSECWQTAEFDWDSTTKGFVLGVFSCGYLLGPLGGMLAIKFGGARIFGVGVAGTAALTVLSPLLLRLHFAAYIFARLWEGIFESMSMAATSEFFLRWTPPNERSRLSIFCLIGSYVGATLNYPLSGFVAYEYGWEAVFYVTGCIGLGWYVFWLACVAVDPAADSFMSKKEKDFFAHSNPRRVQRKKIVYPWRKIFASKPLWAYLNEYFCYSWLYSFTVFCLPLYVKDVYNVNVRDIGLISGVPMLAGCLGMMTAACLSDYLRSRQTFGKPFLHRVFIGIGQLPCVALMVFIGVWANFEQSIICFSLARFFVGFTEMSYAVLVIDVFSEYASLIRGFATTATSISTFLNPIIMGFFVADHTRASWNLYFLFLSVFNIWSFVIYYIYGSGKMEEWAATVVEEEINEENTTEKNLN